MLEILDVLRIQKNLSPKAKFYLVIWSREMPHHALPAGAF